MLTHHGKPYVAFLSTPSARRATHWAVAPKPRKEFLSTPSARRATYCGDDNTIECEISIHALREEGDNAPPLISCHLMNFYPRPPRGGRLYGQVTIRFFGTFLSTPSARRATDRPASDGIVLSDFYPRPPRGGRRPAIWTKTRKSLFLSTPSARRATGKTSRIASIINISIHALREEGDLTIPNWVPGVGDFYPRPPRGGRPRGGKASAAKRKISIHALREEGDRSTRSTPYRPKLISIHALREEGDGTDSGAVHPESISIHALREEGDVTVFDVLGDKEEFLSTPSARRATFDGKTKKQKIDQFLSTPSARRATFWRAARTAWVVQFLSTPSARRATNRKGKP